MKLFLMYAYTHDGTRDFLWAKMLPADFDFVAWADHRRSAMRVLGISRFVVEKVEPS